MTNVLNIISTSNDKCPKHHQHQQWHMSWTLSTPAMTYVLNIMNTSNDTHMYVLNIIHTSNNTCEHHQHQPWYMSQTLSQHYWFACEVHTVQNKLLHNIRMLLLSTVKTDLLTELSYEQNTLESFCNQGVETIILTQLLHQTTGCRHHLLCPGRQQSAGTTYCVQADNRVQAPLTVSRQTTECRHHLLCPGRQQSAGTTYCVQAGNRVQAPLTVSRQTTECRHHLLCPGRQQSAGTTYCVQAGNRVQAPLTVSRQATECRHHLLCPGRHAGTTYCIKADMQAPLTVSRETRRCHLLTVPRETCRRHLLTASRPTHHTPLIDHLLTASRQIQHNLLTASRQIQHNLLTVSCTPSPSKSGPSRQMVTSWKWRQKSRKDIQNSPSSRDSTWIFLLVASSTHCQFTSLTQDGNLHISHPHEYSCSWSCGGTADDRCHKNCD